MNISKLKEIINEELTDILKEEFGGRDEEKDELISIISDLYKEINGFRDRTTNYQSKSMEELDSIYSELRQQYQSKVNESKMKKSKLKQFIKEEIISVLSEESAEDIKDKTDAQKELNKELEKTKELVGEEIDDEEADKAASKGAKKEPIGKISKKLQETQKEMKEILAKFKKAEGAEKTKYLERLKELTKIKKELEKLI